MTTDKAARKARPIARGVLDYFPDAIAEVANVSFVGNQQHNPGEEMHWDKSKSPDHADCIVRHLLERGTTDTDGLRHSAKAAWRALAMLQIELDNSEQHPLEAYVNECKAAEPKAEIMIDEARFFEPERGTFAFEDYDRLVDHGCPPHVARQIVDGTTYAPESTRGLDAHVAYVYIAGPMRGRKDFNFPAFDAARDLYVKQGFNVISPADIDRAAGDGAVPHGDQIVYAFRDFWALYFLAKDGNSANGIVLLPGWEKSIGAAAEFFLARWLGLRNYSVSGAEFVQRNYLHDFALAHAAHTP